MTVTLLNAGHSRANGADVMRILKMIRHAKANNVAVTDAYHTDERSLVLRAFQGDDDKIWTVYEGGEIVCVLVDQGSSLAGHWGRMAAYPPLFEEVR